MTQSFRHPHLGVSERFPAERPALELLRACLEYRFGADVAIGAAAAGDPDDIALSDSGYAGGGPEC